MKRCAAHVPKQHKYDADECDDIEDHDEENWSKEGTPECSNMREKTAVYMIIYNNKKVIILLFGFPHS